METAIEALGIPRPKNLGDILYSFKFRTPLPPSITETEPEGAEWIIRGAGRSKYRFELVPVNRISPNQNVLPIKIPDATPEIIAAYSLTDEQALLAKVRYNRLIDIFLGITAYSMQNHLRTTVSGVGQIEIDEIYVGLNSSGTQFVIPVQAKGGGDQLSSVQAHQDLACCAEKYPALVCRAVSAHFLSDDLIAMFELGEHDGHVKVIQEKHFHLVQAEQITADDLLGYRNGRAD